MKIKQIKRKNSRLLLTLGFIILSGIGRAYGQTLQATPSPDYLEYIRKTADSALKLPPENKVRTYYYQITRSVYDQALQVTQMELARQSGTTNAAFVKTMSQLLQKLKADLLLPTGLQTGATIPVSFLQNVKAALGNFRRYQQPAGMDHERQYLWVMNQVFENLNQINIGYLQAGLSPEEKSRFGNA
ncbi:hypothetical protein ACQ86K_00965 [Mucilaginibacter sp. P19]|uniref:hypothetical protein n=1 Tax=Mucilaginibacter sp. P19 TaxID=3423947 RepID=UPI003D67A184